ncbi:MAG: hypothetical protein IT182_04100 [Acidobacteria bacterium]|nr:hypothetical protein [Acidobacteriota bacterium]
MTPSDSTPPVHAPSAIRQGPEPLPSISSVESASIPRFESTSMPWLVLAALLVTCRALPYVVWGTLAFDADQAVVGLMAKHVAEFRALPVYQYGLPYVLMVTAYVTAPFMWVFGATPFALKLPLLLMNVGVGVATVMAIRAAGLRPAVALLLALPVLVPSAVSGTGLMDALGMSIEPAVFVLALWYARRSPLVFGIVAAVGFHVREFVAYAVLAAVVVDVLSGNGLTRTAARHWTRATMAALGTTALIAGVARFSSVRGPGTSTALLVDGNLSTLGAAFCFVPAQAWRNVIDLGASYLGLLWGPVRAPLSDAAVQSTIWQGSDGAWPVFALAMLLAVGSIAWHWRALWTHRSSPVVRLGTFLALVGAQSVIVYAISRCGELSVLTIRYALLGIFLPTGVALVAWVVSPGRIVRTTLGGAFVGLTILNLVPHARLWAEQLRSPSMSNRAQLGAAMEARGLHYARSDYWTAYYVAFLTHERVIIGSDTLSRVDLYEHVLARHEAEVVRIATRPCDAAPPIVPGYYVCRQDGP